LTRRCFLLALIALAAGFGQLRVAVAADAQPGSPRRIGFLLVGLSPGSKEVQQFRQGLWDAGYSEGRDVAVEWRFANGNNDRIPELVADLVQSKVDVIVVDSTPGTLAAMRATSTIPIVMASIADPVGSGLVANLAHPDANVTGLTIMATDLSAKRLQLLKEAIPRLTRVGVLWNPETPYHPKVIQELKAAAPSLSIELSFADAATLAQFRSAFSKIRRAHAQAIYVIEDGLFVAKRAIIIKLAAKARLPAIFAQRPVVEEGGLISYGPNWGDLYRRSAGYVDKILRGAKPSDLPVEQPTKYELVVNLKTARSLGITIPESILLRADEVIR
jgi:putative ABC transport system substrate-binding protein